MEYLYSLYTKLIADKTHYFVKKIMTFPEYRGVGNVQIGYGMHTDFEKACNICGIDDIACRKQLLLDLEQRGLPAFPKDLPLLPATRLQKSPGKHAVQITGMKIYGRFAKQRAEVLN